jgi:hypothetical protein
LIIGKEEKIKIYFSLPNLKSFINDAIGYSFGTIVTVVALPFVTQHPSPQQKFTFPGFKAL